MSSIVRRTIAASVLGVAALTTVGATGAHAADASVVGVLSCTDKFVDNWYVQGYLSCVA